MKEEDLKKNLDNIIIDGLIKEAQQENADFEAAMKMMSNEDFLELIVDHVFSNEEAYETTGVYADEHLSDEYISDEISPVFSLQTDDFERVNHDIFMEPVSEESGRKRKFGKFVPWLTSTIVAVACILAIVLPIIHHADAKLCDAALMMSRQYLTESKGSLEIVNSTEDEVRYMLPTLETNYNSCIKKRGKFVTYTPELQECGWNLALCYLKLHKKGEAIEVLKVLAQQYRNTPFGNYCENLLKQLD